MSYILEALRKADAERERGAVPDLQSQLLPGSPDDDDMQRGAKARRLWPAWGLALLGLAGVLWWSLGGESSVAPMASQGTAPPATASAPAVAAVAPVASMPASAASMSAPPVELAKTTPKPGPDKAELARKRSEAAAARARKQAEAKAAARDEAMATPQAVPKVNSMAAASAPATLILRLAELPEDLRRQVPALSVGGSVYSPQPDKRMVILNGQVFAEGAMLAPELKLEQIRPKSVLLSIRGQRFELPL